MIEIIPREKAESLDSYIQGVKSKIYSFPNCTYLLGQSLFLWGEGKSVKMDNS